MFLVISIPFYPSTGNLLIINLRNSSYVKMRKEKVYPSKGLGTKSSTKTRYVNQNNSQKSFREQSKVKYQISHTLLKNAEFTSFADKKISPLYSNDTDKVR